MCYIMTPQSVLHGDGDRVLDVGDGTRPAPAAPTGGTDSERVWAELEVAGRTISAVALTRA
jgi:hypothetical protein